MSDNPWWRATHEMPEYEWVEVPFCRMTVRKPDPEVEGDGDVIWRLFHQCRRVEQPRER